MQGAASDVAFRHRHLLGIEGLSPEDIKHVLDLADGYVELSRQSEKKRTLLRGRTIINCFFENSTRTRTSFEVAGKRLGADVVNVSPQTSSVTKGETLLDTVRNLEALRADHQIHATSPLAERQRCLPRGVRTTDHHDAVVGTELL